jgi:hypothetical protein
MVPRGLSVLTEPVPALTLMTGVMPPVIVLRVCEVCHSRSRVRVVSRKFAASDDGRVIDETFGLRPDRIPATAASNFFPHLASSASSRKSKKPD